MAKHADFVRATPGGTPVASQAVTLKKHIDDSTYASGNTDAAGLYTSTLDGSPGPIYEAVTYAGGTKKRSGKSTGQVGVWWQADHPKQMQALGKGVVPGYAAPGMTANDMVVTAGTGLQVKVGTGMLGIDGNVYECTAQTNLAVSANASGSTRIDRIIVRYTRAGQTEEGKCELLMLNGTPGTGVPLALTNDATKQEFSLAKLTVINGASGFVGGDITDERYDTSINQAYAFSWPTGLRNGDLFILAAGKLTRLAIGSNGQILSVASGAPAWAALPDGAVSTTAKLADGIVTNVKIATGIDAAKLADGTVSNAELQFINSLTSNAQTQLGLLAPKASPTFTGVVTSPAITNTGAISTATLAASGLATALTFFGDSIKGEHFIADTGAPPTIAATPVGTYPGAGTTPTSISVTGGDSAGVIQLTIGTGPTTGDICKITFGIAKANTNYVVIITPASNNAAIDIGKVKVTKNTTSFNLNCVSGALNVGSIYTWNYIVMEWA